jgi:outer membrane protein TolC
VPPSVFANNPYNRYGLALVLGLSWTIEPWNVKARADRAKADAHKAHAQSELAAIGARYDAETALAEATAAHTKVDAAATGEKAARTWLASVLQNEAIGTAESRDLVDAYVAWFTLRAQWATSVVGWNVAVVRLGRATGEFKAAPSRPR